ncbi:MAG: cupredoxin domain-containing protein [Vicinamibacterales bacterium]
MRAFSVRTAALFALVTLAAVSPGAAPAQQGPAPRVIEITAERFEFWPSEVVVAEGEEVELRIHSEDTLHGFRLVGGGVNLLVPKRGKGVAVARFTGTRPGRYTFECSRMCGAGHHFMRGELIVR